MSGTPTQQHTPTGPPPVPPVKPILSSPGAYMANYSPGTTGSSSTTTITAGIHSSNKTHEKPAIAARPIPPPTLPKYSSSFNKADRDRNEFVGKIDRTDRDKVWCFSFCSVHLSPLDVYIVVCCQLVFFLIFYFIFTFKRHFC
jgi:hypothetical protein